MRETIKNLLAADTTLMAILTGGVYAGREITRQEMPDAFDANQEILPCALVKLSTESEFGPYSKSARQFVHILFYERSGYTNIDTARARVYALLHEQKLGSGNTVWEVIWNDDVLDQEDPALSCSLTMSSYSVIRNRS